MASHPLLLTSVRLENEEDGGGMRTLPFDLRVVVGVEEVRVTAGRATTGAVGRVPRGPKGFGVVEPARTYRVRTSLSQLR